MNQDRRGWRSGGLTHRKVVVIAGDHRQFLDYCRHKKIRVDTVVEAVNVAAVDGLDHIAIYKTGTWYLRKDVVDIIESLRFRDQVGIDPEEKYE